MRTTLTITILLAALFGGCLSEVAPAAEVTRATSDLVKPAASVRHDLSGSMVMVVRPTGPNATFNASVDVQEIHDEAALLLAYDGPMGSGLVAASESWDPLLRFDHTAAGEETVEVQPVDPVNPLWGRLTLRFLESAYNKTILLMFAAAHSDGPLPFTLWINGTDLEVLSVSTGSAWILGEDAWHEEDLRLAVDPGRGETGAEVVRSRSTSWTTTNGTILVAAQDRFAPLAEYAERELNNTAERWRRHAAHVGYLARVQPERSLPDTILLFGDANDWRYEIVSKASTYRPRALHLVADVAVPDAWTSNGTYFAPFG